MLLSDDQIETLNLTTASDPEVHEVLGVAHQRDPAQAVRRMVQDGIPHVRIGGRIRLHLPALRIWAAEQLAKSVSARAEAQ